MRNIHFPCTVTYRLTEGRNIEGSDQDPLTIASSPVDLPKNGLLSAAVNLHNIRLSTS